MAKFKDRTISLIALYVLQVTPLLTPKVLPTLFLTNHIQSILFFLFSHLIPIFLDFDQQFHLPLFFLDRYIQKIAFFVGIEAVSWWTRDRLHLFLLLLPPWQCHLGRRRLPIGCSLWGNGRRRWWRRGEVQARPWVADERDGFIAWLQSEFAAANAIIDLMSYHLRAVGERGEYEYVIGAIQQRRCNWSPLLHMQPYFPIGEVS